KRRLIQHIQHTIIETHGQIGLPPQLATATLDELQERALYIGFSRRFATYKRAHLLFEDLEALAKILDNEQRPVRFIFAGKAHPADGGGQALIKRIIEVSRMPQFVGKIIFLPDYDIALAKTLIPGVDVWLNNPTRLMEASGTSGEKAEMNGVLNLSVLDGWWYEGYKEGAGWAVSAERTYTDQYLQDQLDAMTIYHLIEQEIVPTYYADMPTGCSDRWVDHIKRSMLYIAPHFTMRRMLDDYYERLYNKLAVRSELLEHQGYQQARDIVAWKQQVAATWDTITVQEATFEGVMREPNYDGQHSDPTFRVTIDAGQVEADIVAELIVTTRDERTGEVQYVGKDLFHEVMPRMGTIRTYELTVPSARPGKYQIAVRLRPYLPELPHLMDFAYVRWISF
uniref:alpha-glucan family phosphorylase n=1 Tax=uncultured Porphyromonas sp. TaxID=159274 RepID=UPI002628761D